MNKPIIPTNSPSIYDQLTTLDRAAIVRPNNPPAGVAGFLFNYDAEEFIELMSEITDNAIEDNTSLQDNIALLPERVTLRGMIAELTDVGAPPQEVVPQPAPLPLVPGLFPPYAQGVSLSFGKQFGPGLEASVSIGLNSPVAAAASINGAIGPFSSEAVVRTVAGELGGVIPVSNPVLAAINAAMNNAVKSLSGGNAPSSAAISAAISAAVGNVVGSALTPAVDQLITQAVNSSLSTTAGTNPGPSAGAAASLYQYYLNRSPVQPGDTAQSLAFGYFYQMWRGRQLFSVETPWGVINDMAVLSVRAEQPEESRTGTNFSVTFKKIRIAQTVTVNLGQLAGRNAFQAAASTPAQNGNAGQTPATPAQEESWLATLLGRATP